MAGAGQASDTNIFGRCCVENSDKILDPSPMAKNRPFFRFGRRALDAAGNFSPPRPRIHLISSRQSSTFTGLARHEPSWPWVDYMSRSKVYRRVSCFWSACRQFSKWTRKFRRVQQREQIILKNKHFVPVFPIAVVREYLQPISFLIGWKENFATSRFHFHRSKGNKTWQLWNSGA